MVEYSTYGRLEETVYLVNILIKLLSLVVLLEMIPNKLSRG